MRDKVPARSPASRVAVTRRHGEKGYEKKERKRTNVMENKDYSKSCGRWTVKTPARAPVAWTTAEAGEVGREKSTVHC